MNDVIDSTAVVVREPDVPTLFGTANPREHIERARETAEALKDVIKQRGLIANIQNKEYVLYDGWTLLGSMVGVSPVNVWTRKIDDGWEARVEVHRNGIVIGAAEAECLRTERMWEKRDDYALRSMAQTRAGAKALRTCLGFIVQLAGYEATPFDEMPRDEKPETRERWGDPQPSDTVRPPKCKSHDVNMKFFKAGTAKASGKPYAAFWKCFIKDCKVSVTDALWRDQLAQMSAPSTEVIDHGDLPNE